MPQSALLRIFERGRKMVSTITARLVSLSNQRAASSSTSTRPTVETKNHRKPHASSAAKRLVKHRHGNPFSSVERRRRERAEMNYRAATTDQALAKAGRSRVFFARSNERAPHRNRPQPRPGSDDDKNNSFQTSEEPNNDCHTSSSDTHRQAAQSNVSSSELSQRFRQRTSSDPDCYDMDLYSGLLSSTRSYYYFGGTETSSTPNNSQPKSADSDPSADRRRAPGFKPTYCEFVASMRLRSLSGSLSDQTAGSTWTASLPTTNQKTGENLDSDNASDTSTSGVSSDSVNSEDEIEMSIEGKKDSNQGLGNLLPLTLRLSYGWTLFQAPVMTIQPHRDFLWYKKHHQWSVASIEAVASLAITEQDVAEVDDSSLKAVKCPEGGVGGKKGDDLPRHTQHRCGTRQDQCRHPL
ncbi:hypothetical protein THAOC_31422, partial [Thalassiosira oceanica]